MVIPEGIEVLSRNLVAVLNEALTQGVAIVPDVDITDGVSYTIEWAASGYVGCVDIEWDRDTGLWGITNAE